MRKFIPSGLAAIVASALALSGCGGSSPSSPSGKGVVLQGTVLSSSGASGVTAHAGPAAASSRIVVTVRENPAISATVSANGTFELENLPAGTITLDFTIDGTLVGTITITGVSTDAEVRIVVQITPGGVVLIQITIDGQDGEDDPPGTPGTPNACLIDGGRPGSSIELEGTVVSGTSSLFKLDIQGNRAGAAVDVNAASASWQCVGKSAADCKGAFKAGNQVHVRGLLTTCTTTAALVNATEVKVQKP